MRDSGPDRPAEQAEALDDRNQRLAFEEVRRQILGLGWGRCQTPLEREHEHPAEAPSDVPPSKRPRRAPARFVPGVYDVRERQVVNGFWIPRSN